MKASPGDKRFDEVFLPYLVDAYRLAHWLAGSRPDAEDIVQEASLRALAGIAGFGGVNPRGWVLAIVRNCAFTWLAKNRRPGLVLSEDLDPGEREKLEQRGLEDCAGEATPEAALIAKHEAKSVRDRVAALPPLLREVLVLREIHELTYQEIAAVVDVPVGTVMSRLARARRALTANTESGQ